METRTVDSIIDHFMSQTEAGVVFPPEDWLKAASMLNILNWKSTVELIRAKQSLAKLKLILKTSSDSVAEATMKIEATDEYAAVKEMEAKQSLVLEWIRIAKKQSDAANI